MPSRICSLFAISAVLLNVCWSQETRGTLVGRVTDATGAVVPNADVQVISESMGTTVALTTNSDGLYTAPLLIPGMYRVTATAQGFKTFVRQHIQLQIADRLEIKVQLEVGASEQSITVSGTPELLNTESASKGSVITQEQIRDLPLSYGNPFGLIGITSGASFTGSVRLDRPFEPSHIANYSMDGTRGLRSDITLDGAPATATANAGEVIASYVPPTDALQEFKVQTAIFDAAAGFTEGGVTTLSIKSGSNAFHGTGYYAITRKELWANDFFTNKLGNPSPDFRFDRWGGSIGGPVWIPKIYKGENKTFFFFSEEGIHDSRPRYDASGTPQVPTDAMKTGDFSSLLSAAAGGQTCAASTGYNCYQIFNPYSRKVAANGQIQVDPFPGNIIPANLINPVGQKILSYWGPTTSPGDARGLNNLQEPDLAEKAKYYNLTGRIDQNFGAKNRLYGRMSDYLRNSLYNNYFGATNPAVGVFFQFASQNAVIDDTILLSPTAILDVRYGYNRFIRWQDGNPNANGFDLTTLGFPSALNSSVSPGLRRFPRIDLSGYIGNGLAGEYRPIDDHSLASSLTKTIRSHSLRGGFEFRSYRENSVNFPDDSSGRYNFDGTTVRGPLLTSTGAPSNIGQSAAALLLGIPTDTNSYINTPASYAEQSTAWGFYFQDDWKISRKLTINAGIRWEFEGALTERYNRSIQNFDPNYVQPFNGAAQAVYGNLADLGRTDPFVVRGATVYAPAGGRGSPLYDTPKLNFMPRLGWAYQLFTRTVVRGGFGQYNGFLGERRGDVTQTGFSQNTPFVGFTPDTLTVQHTLSDPFPNGLIAPTGPAGAAQSLLGQAVTFFNQHPKLPKMYRWQFDIQHQFPGSFLLEAGYVGNKGIDIEINRNINALADQYLSTLNSRDVAKNTFLTGMVPNPLYGLLPSAASSVYSGKNIQRQYLLVPFPGYGAITTSNNAGASWYHSLQTRLEKRFSNGLTIMGNYTFSKYMQATEYLNPGDPSPTRMISDQDIPHRVALDWIYQLPFGKGRTLLSSSNGWVDKIVGGWEVTGIFARQSGTPLNFTGADYFLAGPASSINISGDQRVLEHYFNQSAFVTTSSLQPSFHLRNNPYRFPSVRGPGINNVDLSVIKDTRIREGQTLRFSVQALNAFNHPLLPTPGTNVTQNTFGQIVGSTQSNYPRRLQLELKYMF